MPITRRCSADSTTTCASIQSRQTNKSEDVINGALITLRTIHRKVIKHIQAIELLELNEIQEYMQIVNKLKSDNPRVRELRAKVKSLLRKIYTSFIEFERAISKDEVKLYPQVELTQNCEFLRNAIHIGKKHELPYKETSQSDTKTILSLDMLTNDNFVTMSSDSSRTKSYTNRSLKKPLHDTSKIFVPYNILSSDKENQFKFPHKQNTMNTRKSNLLINRPLKQNRSQLSNNKFNVMKKEIPEIKSNSDSFTVEGTQDVINSSIESKCVINNALLSNQHTDSLKCHKKANISLDTDKFHPKNTEYIQSNFKRKILNKYTERIAKRKCKMFDTIESVPLASERKLGNEMLSRKDSVQCQSSGYGVAYETEQILQESYIIPKKSDYKLESFTGNVADDGIETMESEDIVTIDGEIVSSAVEENKMLLPENIAEDVFGSTSLECDEYGDAAQECIKLLTTFTEEIVNNFTLSDPEESKSFEIVPKKYLKFPDDNEYAEHYKTLNEIHQKYLKMAKEEETVEDQRNELQYLGENFEEWRKLCELIERLEVVDDQ